MKLYLLRHTRLNIASGICYGQTDVDVAASFPEELSAIKSKLANVGLDGCYSSPLQRCRRLAEALAPGEVMIDRRLLELNFGTWELKRWDEIPRAEFDIWANDYQSLSPPGGETFADLQGRARHFIEELKFQHMHKNVLVVSHGGLIRTMLAETLNLSLKDLFRLEVDYGSVTQLNYDNDIPSVGFVNR